jgi:hypothetical protein
MAVARNPKNRVAKRKSLKRLKKKVVAKAILQDKKTILATENVVIQIVLHLQ